MKTTKEILSETEIKINDIIKNVAEDFIKNGIIVEEIKLSGIGKKIIRLDDDISFNFSCKIYVNF